MDRISNLPEELACHVISFLSTKDAARLKYASKKWYNLVTIIQSCVFADSYYPINGSFEVFAARLLSPRHDQSHHRMRRFYLKLTSSSLDPSQCDTVNECLLSVFKRGVLDLELHIKGRYDHYYSLPSELFTCKSVVKLRLGSGFVIDLIPSTALLPSLKSLFLDSVMFDDTTAFTRLISACPVLEELLIHGFNCEDWYWSRVVSSHILKRLTIRRQELYHDGASFDPISFDIPNHYPVVNLSSLVEAKIEHRPLYNRDNYDVTNLIKGLKNVQILTIGAVDTLELFWEFPEAVPVFENLFHLSVCTLLTLLKNSPNLKTLTIEALHYHTRKGDEVSLCQCLEGYSFLLSCHIEILKINQFYGYIGEMVQIKHILEKLQYLVLLEVHVEGRSDDDLQILVDLLMLPRASSKCKVQVMFS
ncbi:hypothetical protein CARUB_v10011486mg [Capsella rubella]|uniref:F-box domain-containing protein n=1 Tax=Capsella rubella TaxID=81985 RepID=R0I7I1_9BRAS|nr:hypothetical protein CARUB_v10011486mg [Capsella rubella]